MTKAYVITAHKFCITILKIKNKSIDMTESLGKLGPHEGQELELLLSGKKSIAYFYELLPIEFIKHLEQVVFIYDQ